MKISLPAQILAVFFIAVFYGLSAVDAMATTRRVPADRPTIQQAINASADGDTVLVAPGVYVENIDFLGKAITVTSESGPSVTAIDGNRLNSVVRFTSGEGPASVLSGFEIRNGSAGVPIFAGGGIVIASASPTITNNIITNNSSRFDGGGISLGSSTVAFPSATITNNVITNNSASSGAGIAVSFSSPLIQGNTIENGQSSFSGGGISLRGAASARILDNTIINNFAGFSGGGIDLFSAGTPTIQGNVIKGNTGFAEGGGISMVNLSDALIVQNLIIDNTAINGGGISWLVPQGLRGPLLVNNTFAGNDGQQGSGIFADGFDIQTEVINNLIIAKDGQVALFCGNFNDVNPPIIRFNDVFSFQGMAYGGICPDKTGIDGNVSVSPLFVNQPGGDYHLQPSSLVIDIGNNAAPNLPATDLDGQPRIQDGNRDGVAIVDMGAYEAPAARPIDLCIQDDSNGNRLQLNFTTGEYQFSNCSGLTVGGTGSISRRGGLITLQHAAADRRVTATVDTSTNRATASVQLLSQGRTFTIADRNTLNNTCACR